MHRLGQHSTSKPLDVQVFDHDCAEVSNESERLPMLILITQPKNSTMNFLKQSNRFATAMRTLFASGDLTLGSAKFSLCRPIPSRIGERIPVRQSSEGFQPDINSDGVVENGKRAGFALDREANIPFSAIPLYCDRFNLARDRAMQFDFDFADTLHTQSIACEFDAVVVTRECDAIETTARLEAREARFLVSLHPKKKGFVRFIDTTKDVLAARKIRQCQVACRSNIFQLIGLVVIIQRLLVAAISLPPFLQCAIIKTAGFAQLLVEGVRLEACRE